jgi:hypothetical protein
VGKGDGGSFRKGLILATCAGLLAVVAGGSAWAATLCARPAEQMGLGSRVLQSEIMIAAYTCGEKVRYNLVVGKFEPELVRHGSALRRLFERSYGAQANRQLNRFVTALANDASYRSLAGVGEYCDRAGALFDLLLAMTATEFETFVASSAFAEKHGVQACGQQISSARGQ